MKDVLIGSVFANDLGLQPQWLDLQLRFIRETTKNYDHVAVVTEGLTTSHFSDRTEVVIPENNSIKWSEAHLQGLNTLLAYFKERAEDYEHFLFIDGDAFPIRKNWYGDLTMKLRPTEFFDESGMALRSRGRYREAAIALRAENLESRLHASILFARQDALQHLDFRIGDTPERDLLGDREADIYLPTYQTERRDLVFPLMRSNQFNVNPVACGVYYDMFYHHSCGSGRAFRVRARTYWDRVVEPLEDLEHFTHDLMADPEGFVSKLAGWNPKRYLQSASD
jgi:hypothetical protein